MRTSLMNLISIALLFLATTAAAYTAKDIPTVNPFPNVAGKSLIWGVDKCESTHMLDKAIALSGLNILDDQSLVSWSCDRAEMAREMPFTGDTGSNCPYPQYMKHQVAICFGRVKGQYPTLCIANPKVAEIESVYGGGYGVVKEARARFGAIYLLTKSAIGLSEHFIRIMDDGGCNRSAPESVDVDGKKISIPTDRSNNSFDWTIK